MATSVGDITAHLRLDTSDWNRELNRVKRRLVGSRLLIAYSYVATAAVAVLAVLLLLR